MEGQNAGKRAASDSGSVDKDIVPDFRVFCHFSNELCVDVQEYPKINLNTNNLVVWANHTWQEPSR